MIVLLATIAFCGIIIIQTLWLKNAIKLKEDELDLLAQTSIVKGFNDKEFIHPSLERSNKDFLKLPDIEKNKLLTDLKKPVDSILKATGIEDDYSYGLLPCNGHRVLLSSDPSSNKQLQKSKIRTTINKSHSGCEKHYALAIAFNDKDQYLQSHLGTQFVLYIILLVLLAGVFIYTVLTLLKQKKIADIKNDFINNMTHELKTPIASIRLASRMLRKTEEIPDKEQTYIMLIENESRRLENQVDKVLQAAVLDSGSLQLEKTNVDVHAVIRKVVDNFGLIAENKNGSIEMELLSDNPIIHADEVHLTNVLYNLLDNAMKYCAKPPKVLISTVTEKNGINILVKDNGIGITSKAQSYIFEKFYRVETGNIHTVKGFGLGLSYVKNIVTAHKGSIRISSQLNNGSEFRLFFPAV